jgi:hypothetical protein
VFGWGSRAFIYKLDQSGISFPIVWISRDDVPSAVLRYE